MIRTSEKIDEISAALCRAQAKFEVALRSSENPFYSKGGKKATYAELSSVIDASVRHLNAESVSVMQHPAMDYREDSDGALHPFIIVTTRLQHSSGQFFESDFALPASNPGKFDAQTCGSATTYACRYALQSILALRREDDDGNAASGVGSQNAANEVAARKVEEAKQRQAKRKESGPVPVERTLFYVHFPESNTYEITGQQELMTACREALMPYYNRVSKSVAVPEEKLDDLRFILEQGGVGMRQLQRNEGAKQ